MSSYSSLFNETIGTFDSLKFPTGAVPDYFLRCADYAGNFKWSPLGSFGVVDILPTALQTTISSDGKGTYTVGTVQNISTTSSPTFYGIKLTNGAASGKVLTSDIDGLASWSSLYIKSISGTTNQVNVSDLDGKITLSLPQAIASTSDVKFNSITLTSGAANGKVLTSDASGLASWSTEYIKSISGTTNQVNVNSDGNGNITLSLPQSINTFSNVSFGTVTAYLNGTANDANFATTATGATQSSIISIPNLATAGKLTLLDTQPTIGASLLPLTDVTYNLGSSSYKFANIYGTLVGNAQTATSASTVSSSTQSAIIYLPNVQTVGSLSNMSTATKCATDFLPDNDLGHNLGSNSFRWNSIYGTIATSSQPNITSLGTLTGLTTSGATVNLNNSTFYLNDTSGTPSILRLTQLGGVNYIQSATSLVSNSTADLAFTSMYAGGVEWLRMRKSTNDITSVSILPSVTSTYNLGSNSLVWNSIYGTIATSSQPNITSLGGVLTLSSATSTLSSKLTSTYLAGDNNLTVVGGYKSQLILTADVGDKTSRVLFGDSASSTRWLMGMHGNNDFKLQNTFGGTYSLSIDQLTNALTVNGNITNGQNTLYTGVINSSYTSDNNMIISSGSAAQLYLVANNGYARVSLNNNGVDKWYAGLNGSDDYRFYNGSSIPLTISRASDKIALGSGSPSVDANYTMFINGNGAKLQCSSGTTNLYRHLGFAIDGVMKSYIYVKNDPALTLNCNGVEGLQVTSSGLNAISIMPTVSSTYNLGSSSYYWSNLYVNNITANGIHNFNNSDLYFSDTSATPSVLRIVQAGGANYIQSATSIVGGSTADLVFSGMYGSIEWLRLRKTSNDITSVSHLPSATTTYNLGSNSLKWNSGYIENLYSAGILFNGSNQSTLQNYNTVSQDFSDCSVQLNVSVTAVFTQVGNTITCSLTNIDVGDGITNIVGFTLGSIPSWARSGKKHRHTIQTQSVGVSYIGICSYDPSVNTTVFNFDMQYTGASVSTTGYIRPISFTYVL